MVLYWVIKVLRTKEAQLPPCAKLQIDRQTAVTVRTIKNLIVPPECKDSIMHNLLSSSVISISVQSNYYPADHLPPGEVTVLSPCSCWCLVPHASHIPSPHLVDTRCSWIISQTGESVFPLQLNLNLCYISFNSDTSRHVQAIFAQIFL